MGEFVCIPMRVFTDHDLSYVTQSLGVWLCFLCNEANGYTVETTLSELEGHVGERLSAGDIYRLARIHLLSYQEPQDKDGHWTIKLLTTSHKSLA